MTQRTQVAHIARRVIRAVEGAPLDSLRNELHAAEQFASSLVDAEAAKTGDQERSELLGAIAHDMTARLAGAHPNVSRELRPHVTLLYHLSGPRGWVN